MIRVIPDANVWLSFVISPYTLRPITKTVLTCLRRTDIDLLVPTQTIAEIERTLTSKDYYLQRNAGATWEMLKPLVTAKATLVEPNKRASRIGRDPNDEYLLVAAEVYGVDALVTGDKDLLALRALLDTHICTVTEFLQLLKDRGIE